MAFFYIFLAFVGGMMLPTQAGVNAQLRLWVKGPFHAAVISFAVGALSALLCSYLLDKPWPRFEEMRGAPWWVWFGGALGAAYVTAALVSAPRLGAVTLVSLVITGMLVASIVLDHFGLVGYPVHRVNLFRMIGIGFLAMGIFLVHRY